jgi:hypothetical protein
MRPRTPEAFIGYWRITEMEVWSADYLDLVVPAFIEFDRDQMGRFQFGTVRGWLDCRFGERDGGPSKWMSGASFRVTSTLMECEP